MQFIREKFFSARPVRFLIVASLCTVLLLSNALPAAAVGGSDKGGTTLDEIVEKAEQVVKQEPRSMQEVQAEANKSTNTVQGSANKEKMEQSQDSKSGPAIAEDVNEAVKDMEDADYD